MRKIFTLLLMAIMAIGYSWAAEKTIDFVGMKFQGGANWSTSYAVHEVKDAPFLVSFDKASWQKNPASSSITD